MISPTIYSIAELVVFLVSFGAAILSLVISIKSGTGSININYLLLIMLGSFIAALMIKVLKILDLARKRFRSFSRTSHSIAHIIRDAQYKLRNTNTQNHYTEVDNLMRSTVKEVINLVEKFLSDSTSEKISVCVFSFELYKKMTVEAKKDLKNCKLRIVARSTNTDSRRLESSHLKVSDNTNFETMISRNLRSLKTNDLEKFNKEQSRVVKVKQSRPDYLDFYKSTISVPIRIKLVDDPDTDHDLLGILSADGKKRFAFQGNDIDLYEEYLLGVGDQLYPFLDQCRIKLNSVS